MDGVPTVHGVGAALMMIALMGAARADADDTQLERLRVEVLPMMRDKSVTYRTVAEQVIEIMGSEWEPRDTPHFGAWIRRMLADRGPDR